MGLKIALIGGGSFLWTGTFATDFFLKESLRGSEMVLVDTDPDALGLMVDYCRLLNDQLSANWKINAADIDTAMDGADVVVVSISTGGLTAFDKDYRIPEKYGVFHSVGDTVGPAGISRTLRNVPVFLDIARKVELLCPDAWLIHVTNPLAQITRAISRTSDVKVVGLCHNYEGTMGALAQYLGVDRSEVDADTFGINHFSWLENATCRGEPCEDAFSLERYCAYEEARHKKIETGTTDDDINSMTDDQDDHDEHLAYRLYERFGYFPVGGVAHIVENLPYYLNSPERIKKHRIRRKGVLPYRLDGKELKRKHIQDILAGREPLHPLMASHEDLAHIVEALHTQTPCRAVVNLPNSGQIENIERDVVVETWAQITPDAITPSGTRSIPVGIKGLTEAVIAEEELAVEAALTGNSRLVVEAMYISPLLHNKEAAEPLAAELLKAQSEYLPQFSQCMPVG